MGLGERRIYLDFNATTPLADEVAGVLDEAQRTLWGNPSSSHAEGRAAAKVLQEARAQVASLVECEPGEVTFTGSATEANHLAVHSACRAAEGRPRVLMSAIEHPAVYDQRQALEAKGLHVEEIPVTPQGTVDVARLEKMLGGDVALVCVMAAHNETGVLQPVDEVGALCEARGAWFHTDAVQALGKVPSPWLASRASSLAVAAHKLCAPKGIGALVVRRGKTVSPLLAGGGQEGGRRASTEAVPLAVAFGRACLLANEALPSSATLRNMRDALEDELRARFGAVVHGHEAPRLPNTSFFSIPGADGSALAAALDGEGIAVSTGSACHDGRSSLPRVLRAMGAGMAGLSAPLRVSLGRDTTRGEVAYFMDRLGTILTRVLREET